MELYQVILYYGISLLFIIPNVKCIKNVTQNTTVVGDDLVSSAIEEEVLGPLRIWHIVFIVTFFLLIAMVAVFCCVEIRVPRSRQEIEENYKKRILNQRYVRMLEKAPEQLMRAECPKPEVAVVSSKQTNNSKGKQQQTTAAKGWQQMTRNAMSSKTSSRQDDEGKSGVRGFSMLGNLTGGTGPQPLAINPKDILAIMAQQRKTKTNTGE